VKVQVIDGLASLGIGVGQQAVTVCGHGFVGRELRCDAHQLSHKLVVQGRESQRVWDVNPGN